MSFQHSVFFFSVGKIAEKFEIVFVRTLFARIGVGGIDGRRLGIVCGCLGLFCSCICIAVCIFILGTIGHVKGYIAVIGG